MIFLPMEFMGDKKYDPIFQLKWANKGTLLPN